MRAAPEPTAADSNWLPPRAELPGCGLAVLPETS